MTTLWLKLVLQSDATFGRGDGVAGVVDEEVQHDEYGLPFLGGKTLKGLLGAECADILFALHQMIPPAEYAEWQNAAHLLFGDKGSAHEGARLHVGDARVPSDLSAAVHQAVRALTANREPGHQERIRARERTAVLESSTTLRRQTAMDPATGAPRKETLRTMRVILRETSFVSRLDADADVIEAARARALLAACVAALRRAGTGRNRGRGKLRAELFEQDLFDETGKWADAQPITRTWLDEFEKEIQHARPRA